MVCRRIGHLGPSGALTVIVCSRGQCRRSCRVCGEPASLQCDFPRPRKRSGTCDAYLCERCAVEIDPETHHCPTHDPNQGNLPGMA